MLDPLLAQALLLEDATGRRQLWISLDLIGMDHGRAAALRQVLSALTAVPYEAVVLNFAHVHSGPITNFHKYPPVVDEPAGLIAYYQTLSHAVQRVAEMALTALQPVTITVHHGTSDVGINRRRPKPEGGVALAPTTSWRSERLPSIGARALAQR